MFVVGAKRIAVLFELFGCCLIPYTFVALCFVQLESVRCVGRLCFSSKMNNQEMCALHCGVPRLSYAAALALWQFMDVQRVGILKHGELLENGGVCQQLRYLYTRAAGSGAAPLHAKRFGEAMDAEVAVLGDALSHWFNYFAVQFNDWIPTEEMCMGHPEKLFVNSLRAFIVYGKLEREVHGSFAAFVCSMLAGVPTKWASQCCVGVLGTIIYDWQNVGAVDFMLR